MAPRLHSTGAMFLSCALALVTVAGAPRPAPPPALVLPASRRAIVRFDRRQVSLADTSTGLTPDDLVGRFVITGRSWLDTQAPPPVAVSYSEGYQVRARIHKAASIAMLPLFGTEAFLGQSIFNHPTSGKRGAHVALGAAIGTLFAVNTVTGVWNLLEARHDSNGRKRRVLHGLLMAAADAGFAVTPLLAPDDDEGGGSRTAHRAVALTSMAIATAGYLVMLVGGHRRCSRR